MRWLRLWLSRRRFAKAHSEWSQPSQDLRPAPERMNQDVQLLAKLTEPGSSLIATGREHFPGGGWTENHCCVTVASTDTLIPHEHECARRRGHSGAHFCICYFEWADSSTADAPLGWGDPHSDPVRDTKNMLARASASAGMTVEEFTERARLIGRAGPTAAQAIEVIEARRDTPTNE